MTAASPVVTDYRGRPVLTCSRCGQPLTSDDFFELGLRTPDHGESRDDYHEAELVDTVQHLDCASLQVAG